MAGSETRCSFAIENSGSTLALLTGFFADYFFEDFLIVFDDVLGAALAARLFDFGLLLGTLGILTL